jgi:hypothetical protein
MQERLPDSDSLDPQRYEGLKELIAFPGFPGKVCRLRLAADGLVVFGATEAGRDDDRPTDDPAGAVHDIEESRLYIGDVARTMTSILMLIEIEGRGRCH